MSSSNNTEPHYNSMHINQYSLSIRFSSDGFSLSIFDEFNSLLSTKKISALLFSLSEEEIIHLILQEPETQVSYRKVRLICESDVYAFAPIQVFRQEDARDLLSFQHKLEKKDFVLFNKLPKWDVVNVFTIPIVLHAALLGLYPDTPIEHQVSHFLTDYVLFQSENSVQIWVGDKTMDVVVLKNGNIILMNSYNYQTPEDFTYYTLNLFEQLSLDTESCKVRMFNVEKNNQFNHHLQKYVKHCETAGNSPLIASKGEF